MKVIYFTAGAVATNDENTEIAAIRKNMTVGDELLIRDGSINARTTFDGRLEDCDAVAGTVPAAYSAVDVFDEVDTTRTLEADDTITVNNSAGSKSVDGTVVIAADGSIEADLASTEAIVSDTQALTGVAPSGSYTDTVTFTVANGVITAIVLS